MTHMKKLKLIHKLDSNKANFLTLIFVVPLCLFIFKLFFYIQWVIRFLFVSILTKEPFVYIYDITQHTIIQLCSIEIMQLYILRACEAWLNMTF